MSEYIHGIGYHRKWFPTAIFALPIGQATPRPRTYKQIKANWACRHFLVCWLNNANAYLVFGSPGFQSSNSTDVRNSWRKKLTLPCYYVRVDTQHQFVHVTTLYRSFIHIISTNFPLYGFIQIFKSLNIPNNVLRLTFQVILFLISFPKFSLTPGKSVICGPSGSTPEIMIVMKRLTTSIVIKTMNRVRGQRRGIFRSRPASFYHSWIGFTLVMAGFGHDFRVTVFWRLVVPRVSSSGTRGVLT